MPKKLRREMLLSLNYFSSEFVLNRHGRESTPAKRRQARSESDGRSEDFHPIESSISDENVVKKIKRVLHFWLLILKGQGLFLGLLNRRMLLSHAYLARLRRLLFKDSDLRMGVQRTFCEWLSSQENKVVCH